MKTYARPLIIGLSAFGLAASVAALYVHYRLLADPSYTSFCDVSATVSCEAVLTSQYGYLFGVPVAGGGAVWSALVLLLGVLGMGPAKAGHYESGKPTAPAAAKAGRHEGPAKAGAAKGSARAGQEAQGAFDAARPGRVAGYIFLLSTIGLAAVLYLGYASFFVLRQACPLCMAMYVSVIGLFIVSGGAASDLSAIPGALGRDVRAVTASPLGVTLAVVWIVVAVGLVGWFPGE
ncbi:MAG: hypothetical protein HYU37_17860, partial [Acidobacteria bacterium]|nr:hypothetical protein [Acidobacteriota bacterium]